MSMADEIREARHRASITQAELAQACGVSRRTVQLWEHGKSYPRPRRRRMLLRFLVAVARAGK